MRCVQEAAKVMGCSSKNSAGAYAIWMPLAAQKVENWMSSVSVWKSQPCMPWMTRELTIQPEPEMAQLVPRSMRELLRNLASRRNHSA